MPETTGFWACPTCGKSSGTPFICEGLTGRPHAPTSVEYGAVPAAPAALPPVPVGPEAADVAAVLRWLDAGDAWPQSYGPSGTVYCDDTAYSGRLARPTNAGAIMHAALLAHGGATEGGETDEQTAALGARWLEEAGDVVYAAAVRRSLSALADARAALAAEREDAARWRALMGCDHIRVLGSAQTGYAPGRGHLGVEFYGEYPTGVDSTSSRKWFTEYVDGLVRAALPTPRASEVERG